ncbi:SIS domain-containing protein [Enterococcus hirae]|uniref:SIS domain-containing protein n=1 Tax=Enterococcus hirae TaxID=1354 RepID=UPI001A9586AB|nr:SIS domain-containing protein [Enterococcus hirae]MBO1089217.1 SIS domain-containing protein [Enterococcus hirae]
MVTMLDYIHEEKTALSAILEKNDSSLHVSYQNMQHVLILATGSSYNACLAAKPALESYGDITVDIQEPYHFNHYGKLSEEVDTVIAVSQSGKSASTVDAIRKIRSSKRRTIALTGDDQSPITKEVDQVIDLNMGVEKVGFVTKGYSATVLQLILLGLAIGTSKDRITAAQKEEKLVQLREVVMKIPQIIAQTEQFFEKNEALFRVAKRFIAIGYGPNWGTAKEFETKFTETVREPSQGFELEAYMHGPYLEANPGHILFFLENNSDSQKRSQRLAQYMKQYVGQVIVVTTEGETTENQLSLGITSEEDLSVLALVVPIQVLAYKIATAKGIDLGQRIFDDFDEVLKSKI